MSGDYVTGETPPWSGHWAWIHSTDMDGPELGQTAGRIGNVAIGLPPEVSAKADSQGLWESINGTLGTMLDIFESDEIDDPEQLVAIANIVDSFFRDEPDVSIAREISAFLRRCAATEVAVEFWL